MSKIVHENAVIGQVVDDDLFYVKIFAKSVPKITGIAESVEGLLYEGKENDLFMTQRYKLEYRCEFLLKNYPFDKQTCDFIMMIDVEGNHTINFEKSEEAFLYKGPRILQAFQLTELHANTTTTEYRTRFVYSIGIERLYMHILSTTFFQSFIMWFIAYFTLFINTQDFTNRFMGALTSLLVLAALLTSINASLPQTAYFKHIDVWFLILILNIVVIIVIHIVVDIFTNKEKPVSFNPRNDSPWLFNFERFSAKFSSESINNIAKLIFPVFLSFFMVIYFLTSTSY